ncbi:MAG: methionine synthase [Actinobacteria bacterium HGW-Actinobacteria-2]|nr:MAG: methionine synthase [Actinobacteria bacterium HGW-Actinobacteria-2]
MVTVTGLGSLPGTDFASAARMTFDKVEDFPYLPELPARGPWAQLIGRGLGLPDGLPADLQAGEWRLADAPGIDQRRARATWRDDLDVLEENAQGYTGRFKVAVAGPWTLAASLGVAHTGRVLADRGARRDLAQSLAESVSVLLADLHRRLPGAELVLQLDEPSLPAVAAGAVPTPGGFFRHRAVDVPEIVTALGWIAAAADRVGVRSLVHSCAPWKGPGAAWPLPALVRAGIGGMSLDIDTLTAADLDQWGESLDAGLAGYLGVLPTVGEVLGVDALATRTLRLLDRLGNPDPASIVLTPACGMASWTPAQVSQALASLRRVSQRVAEDYHRG